jgi:hypothetical protein
MKTLNIVSSDIQDNIKIDPIGTGFTCLRIRTNSEFL